MQTKRRTPLRVIAVTSARVVSASRLTSRKPIPVPNALTTASQPSKARPEDAIIAGIALDQFSSRQLGARRRANQRHDGMAFRHGVADDQPSGSARCSQNKNLQFNLDRS